MTEKTAQDKNLLYNLDENPPLARSLVYAVQWLFFTLANSAVVPVVVGNALALDQAGIAMLAQRTLLLQALASFFQVFFGHRLPIFEGPSGMWWGVFISLAALAPSLGKPMAVLRTDLELGLIITGILLMVVGFSGLLSRTLKLFTPPVTGTVLVLLGLQMSGTFVKGMLGITASHQQVDLKAALISIVVLSIIIGLNLKAKNIFSSIAILVGIIIGWILAAIGGLTKELNLENSSIIALPQVFAWGEPTFDFGIILTCILTGLLVLSNLVASILAMERVMEVKLPEKSYDRGVAMTGFADVLSGFGATVGFVPYSAGAAMVSLTRVAARLPFIIFTIILFILGLLPALGAFLASIPEPVGYAALLASFCQMVGFGLKDFASTGLTARDYYVIGLPLLVGTGLMFLPIETLQGLPTLLRYIIGNGFIAGMLLA
ncbi:MAG: purine/pyrimidine permease, partial [Peptococcaceae bacterium]|nr:purine/pyrimidine permease [Peptococcaceae bacterium]